MSAGTNLAEAGVYIGATTTPSTVAVCTDLAPNSGETSLGTITIGGANFAAFTSTDQGAGNIYQGKTYRRVQNGACLEIVELLHYGNINNYTAGQVVQFDQAKFQGILDSIVQSYRPTSASQ